MKGLFRFISFLLIFLACVVTARYAYAKYLQGNKSATIDQALETTQGDLITGSQLVNEQLGNILGVKTNNLPDVAKQKLDESQTVKQIQEEVNNIVEESVNQAKQLPATEIKKIKKDVAAEICKQLLQSNE